MACRCAVLKIGSSAVAALLLTWACGGCVQLAAVWTNITGGDVVDPQYTLTKGPLLILIDDRESRISEPQAVRQLHKTIADGFLDSGVNRRVIAFEDCQALQRSAKEYDQMAVREIGEKLGADQVLYLEVERFTLQSEPGAPLFKGEFAVRVKVLSTERKHDVRLWPREEGGRRVSVSTDPIPTDSGKSAVDVARELATKLGDELAKMFYEHRALD